jgi:hypothetical protein
MAQEQQNYNEVAEPCAAYQQMAEDWHICDTLLGGTPAMRAAGREFLPKFDAESSTDYKARLQQTVLYNVYKEAIRALVGKLFDKGVTLGDDVPGTVQEYAENIDRQGRSLNVFMRDVTHDAINRGKTHIMVDAPAVTGETVAEQRARGERPYCVHFPADEVIGWKEEVIQGERILTQVRRKHTVTVDAGPFATGQAERVTVYNLEEGQAVFYVFENQKKAGSNQSNWQMIDQGSLNLTYIPLVTLYTNRTGFMRAQPPLLDLAYKNVEHWQSSSDQRHILKWSRFAVPYLLGFDSQQDQIEWGPSSAVVSSNENAKVGFAEHSGASIEMGFKDLEKIEADMGRLSMQPMMHRTGNQVATARALDESSASSSLEAWAEALKDATEQVLQYLADRAQAGNGGSAEVASDLSLSLETGDEGRLIYESFRASLIPKKVAFLELQRLGKIDESWEWEEVEEMYEAEKRGASALQGMQGV